MSLDPATIRAALAPVLRSVTALTAVIDRADELIIEQSRLDAVKQERDRLAAEVTKLRGEQSAASTALADLTSKVTQAREAIKQAEAAQREAHASHAKTMLAATAALDAQKVEHATALEAQTTAHQQTIAALQQQHAQALRELEKIRAAKKELLATLAS